MVLSILYYILSYTMMHMSLLLLNKNMVMFLTFPILSPSSMNMNMSLLVDWMSLMFAATVSLISASIMIFSQSYIPKKEHKRFSLILLSFILSMIVLIFSNNIFFMMLGWDGLGFSSYILVIYYQNYKASESGSLTILSNRVGDIAIIMAIAIMSFSGSWEFFMSFKFPLIVSIMLMIAAMSKSAQMPFMAWLPAAMAAPTPISALVHSSTLVTAGVYLMIRSMNTNHPLSMSMILLMSTITLLLAGMSANWEQDMKKIIALSTLSQIAMMMFAISINSTAVTFFHLITHALFKSTMFLCAGSIIHGTYYQDTRAHGSSSNNSPILLSSLGITSMALMGLPFMSGYFSKDMIIETFYSSNMNTVMIMLMLTAVGLTASYSMRMNSFSTMFITKMQKDKLFNLDNNMFTSLIIMTPTSIFMGSLLLWLTMTPQLILIPLLMKMSTLIMISMGLLMGILLQFKSDSYLSLGETSINLWYSHTNSCNIPLKSLTLSSLTALMDKTWLEMLSAQGMHKTMNIQAKTLTFLKMTPMTLAMLTLSIPMFFSAY